MEDILIDIRQALGYAEDDDSHDEEIKAMSKSEKFRLYCQWNGLVGGWSQKLEDVLATLSQGEITVTLTPIEARAFRQAFFVMLNEKRQNYMIGKLKHMKSFRTLVYENILWLSYYIKWNVNIN